MEHEESLVIAISSNKGGVLKTSIATSLAGEISKTPYIDVEKKKPAEDKKKKSREFFYKKTCLIDMDSQGNVGVSFGTDPDDQEQTIYDLLMGNIGLDEIDKCITNVAPNLDIIMANDDMSYWEIDVLTEPKLYPKPLTLLVPIIEKLKDLYDVIIIDTPPQLGLTAVNIFNAAEDIIIPYHPELYSFRSLVKTISAIDRFKQGNEKLNVKMIIPVKVRKTVTHEAFIQSAKSLAKQYKIQFSGISIPESIRYAETIGRYQMPITLVQEVPKSFETYQEVYTNLAKELGYIG